MKRALLFLMALTLWPGAASAQTNASIRLALIAPEAALRPAVDLLTVELSRDEKIVLLERAEIERILQEQSLAATSPDYLKVGQVLGADGLLVAEIIKEGATNAVALRLVAVKPGVVLGTLRSPWPVTDVGDWVKGIPGHFAPLLPKLGVLAKDAVPISLVNLRAAVSSRETRELEQQLTLLAIERLTRERELFVLERRRLDLLSAEKELKSTADSAFWNGSYLLDGVIDRDGYSKERVTLNARLVPPAGGLPLEMLVTGPRTNLASVVEQLTAQVLQTLKRGSSPAVWQPEAEAQKYFEEARWALKWGILEQAKAASESAWALGKSDLDCALVRVRSYLPGVPPDVRNIYTSTHTAPRDYNPILEEVAALRPLALHYDEREIGDRIETKYLYLTQLPDPQSLDRALHALGLYADFTDSLSAEEPKSGSPWYYCGLEALDQASLTLNYFHLVSDHVSEHFEKLAELRALARTVAARLTQPPSVRDGYWVGRRIASHDELAHSMAEPPHIFRTKLKWGCFWQEKPQDALDVYRELLSSPVFCYFHTDFWLRELSRPRLVGWTKEDRARIPAIWSGFMQELNASTNFLWRMEAKALEFADAKSDDDVTKPFEELFAIMFANHDAMVTNNVEVPYLGWGLSALVNRNGIIWPNRSKLQASPHFQRLRDMETEWWRKMNELKAMLAQTEAFERQKEYLKANTAYEFPAFNQTFRLTSYSPVQAAELAPLLAGYKSNLTSQIEEKTGPELARLRTAIARVGIVESAANRVLKPPSQPTGSVASSPHQPTNVLLAEPVTPPRAPVIQSSARPHAATNALVIDRFVAIPSERFKEGHAEETLSEWTVISQSFHANRLWLDVRYKHHYAERFPGGSEYFTYDRAAAAVWDPQRDEWEFIPYPKATVPPNRLPMEYAGSDTDAIYVSGWEYLRKYEFKTRQWESFPAPWQKPARLFRVGDRLFAAGDEAIFEIRDGGRNLEILASSRRRPAVSALDSMESLGSPLIFPGPGNLIRAAIAGKIFAWNGQDWTETPGISVNRLEVFDTAALAFGFGMRQPSRLWMLPHSQTNGILCLREEWRETGPQPSWSPRASQPKPPEPDPQWKSLPGLAAGIATPLVAHSNLYFYVESHTETNQNGRATILEKDGRHANLVRLDTDSSLPLVIPLKFDLNRGALPATSLERVGVNTFNMERKGWIRLIPGAFLFGRNGLPGFWVMPEESINRAFIAQKEQVIQSQRVQLEATRKQTDLVLGKYDADRNGKITAGERAAAIGDPVFLAFDLRNIDANQNHQLDADELAGFDVNQNHRLDPNEEAGVNAFMHILAARTREELDEDENGLFVVEEFSKAYGSTGFSPVLAFGRNDEFSRADKNNDRSLDTFELEDYLKERTQRSLRLRPVTGRPPAAMQRPGNSQVTFKESVEAYWNPARTTNAPSLSPAASPAALPAGKP